MKKSIDFKDIEKVSETLPISNYISDLKGNLIYANSVARKTFGFLKKDLVKSINVIGLLAPEEKKRATKNMKKLVKEGGMSSNEYVAIKKNGEVFNVLIHSKIIRKGDGKSYIMGTLIDISMRKNAENKLKKAEEKYRGIFENSVVGIFQSTLSGKFISVNDAFAKMIGYGSPDELYKSIRDISNQLYVNPSSRKELIKVLRKEGQVSNFECRFYTKKKEEIWVSINARLVKGKNGKVLYLEGTNINITERKKIEENLKQSNVKFHSLNQFNNSIIDGISDEVIVVNPNTHRIIHANKQVLKRTGLSLAKIKKKHCFELYHDKNDPGVICHLMQSALLKKKHESEMRIYDRRLKRHVHIQVTFYPLFNKEGEVDRVVHLTKNITERKKYESKLARLNNTLLKLYDTSSALQKSMDLDKIYSIAIKTFESLGFDRIRIYLHRNDSLYGVKANHVEDAIFKKLLFPVKKSYRKAYKCMKTKKPTIDVTSGRKNISKTLNKPAGLESGSLPLLSENKVVGMISIDNKISKTKIREEDLQSLMTFTNQIASAIDSARLYQKNLRQVRKLSTLYDISSAISQTLDMDKILSMVVIRVVKLLKVDRCSIMLLDSSKKRLMTESVFDQREMETDIYYVDDVDKSISGHVIKTNKPFFIEDIKSEKMFSNKKRALSKKLVSMLSVPMALENVPLGVMNVYTRQTRVFSQDEMNILMTLANHVSIMIDNSRLYERIKNDKDNFSSLLSISEDLNRVHDTDELMQEALRNAVIITNANHGMVVLFDGKTHELKCSSGLKCRQKKNVPQKITKGLISEVAKKGKIKIVGDVSQDKRYVSLDKNIRSAATLPIIKKGNVMGVLHIESNKIDMFKNYAKSLGILTNHISIALENIRLYDEVLNFNKKLESEIKVATKELREKNLELQKMDEMKSDFVSNVSHELRTPLTSISGYTKLLFLEKLGSLNSKQKDSLGIVSKESERLTRLINDVLDLSKLESGKTEVKFEEIDLKELADETVKTFMTIADEKKISLNLKPYKNNIKVEASYDLIKQVLINLINNAIKFTNEKGCVSLSFRVVKRMVEVTVKDTGKGISKEYLPKLFDKFFQVDSSMTRKYGGTGLGLVIVKHILDLHNGSIEVESDLGKGSKFKFSIPLKQSKENKNIK